VELLHQDTEICFFPNRQNEFKEFFSQENDLVFGNDICSVTEALWHQHDPNEWCLFTDPSKVIVKAVLLRNGNKFPFVPIAYAANLKESYENIKLLLENIQYEKYNCNICGNIKDTALLLGLQLGYTKLCCFRCKWDSMDSKNHYICKQ
jgi:hypothetical protein